MSIVKKRHIGLTAREVKFLPEGLHRDQAGLYAKSPNPAHAAGYSAFSCTVAPGRWASVR